VAGWATRFVARVVATDVPAAGSTAAHDTVEALRLAGSSPVVACFPQGAVIVFDHDLRYLSAGGLGLADVGLSRELLEGHTIDEVFPAEVVAAIEPSYRLALAGEESEMDVPYQGRTYLMRLGPLRDADGAVIAGMGFTQDVTRAREDECALRESEDRFRSAFEDAPIGKALVDVQGRHMKVNGALCALTGYSEQQLLGLTVAEITHPGDRAADRAAIARLLAGEASTYTMEKRYLTATGQVIWTTSSVSLVRAGDGSPLHLITQVQDITERKGHERVLAEERRRLHDAQVVGRVGSWELEVADDADHKVTWSDSLFRLYGLDPEEFAGNYAAALGCIHPADRGEVDAATTASLSTGVPLFVRYRVSRFDDGALRWFDARGEAVYAAGRVIRMTGAVADVTEQVLAELEAKAARDEALEASRHKSAFLATMSHEIRTPMNAVIGLTGLLLDTELDTQQREFVETVRDSGDTLLVIINDILDFSKIESGGLQLEQQRFDSTECVEGSLDLLASAASAKGLELVGYVGGSPRRVLGDASRLRQVLVNLLSNAVKFTPRGQVLVEVEPQPGTPAGVPLRVTVTVTDSGIGIPEDRMHSLFDAFSQVDASTTRVYGGTGLGLTISQRLVEAMGGQIHVTSTVGEGSAFSFSVLLGDCDDSTLPADDRPTAHLHGRTALVVDDNATNLRILRLQLEGWGMCCACATNPDDALALVAAGARYDIAVIDMNMPGMNGQQLAAELKRQPGSLALPVVLLSSMGGLPASGGEFAAVLTKPVKGLALHQALAAALAPATGEAGLVVAPPLHQQQNAAEPPAPRLRILLAEDNLVNQRVGRLLLDKLGHHVDVVANGAEAVRALHELAYDVVLMDVHMPQMDGLEATRRIRAELPQQRQPRIVAMTASALAEDREACHGAGMDGYLAKPVRSAELAAVLR